MRVLMTLSLFFAIPITVCAQLDWGDGPSCARAKQPSARLSGDPEFDAGMIRLGDERAADTDVRHYNLDITIDPNNVWLGGSNTMTIRSRVDSLLTFDFLLYSGFTISAVRVGGTPAAWVRVNSSTVSVALDRPYQLDEEFELYVEYAGRPPAWGGATFQTRSGQPEVYTLSEPWYACTWWPTKDDLTDKTVADMSFTVPAGMIVASNGLLVGVDDVDPAHRRYHWRTDYPTADYLYCFGATNYDLFDATWTYQGQTMPLQFFIYPEDNSPPDQARWLQTTDMLTTLSDLFGLYPFVNEKYGMLEWGENGGMEHQTLTSILGNFWWEEGIVHELAHQWWGDNVTCATWHDIWLNEGFATYAEALWFEHKPGGNGDLWLHLEMAYRRPHDPNGTVYCYDSSSSYRIFDYDLSYLKGSWVLHMLRHVVGDAVFYDILAAYRAAFEGRSATTEDFRRVAEAVTGRDLTWFFSEWVYEGGTPAYEYAWRQSLVGSKYFVELYIRQTQPADFPTFTMPIDITTTDSSGTHTHVMWNDAREEHLLFAVSDPNITALAFDPKPWILQSGLTAVSFVEGPPKIVGMRPAPGAMRRPSDQADIEIVFHKDVVAAATDFSLAGMRSGPIPCSFAYDNARQAVTLVPTAPLVSDTYTLTVFDSIVDVAAGKQLDGELSKPDGPNPLPSGDGLPGGSAVAQFVVTDTGDLNCDGVVDADDIWPFVMALRSRTAYEAAYPGCPFVNADCNSDGHVNYADISPFVRLLPR